MVKLSFIPFISIAGRTFSKEKIKKTIRKIETKNGCASLCSECPLKNSLSGFNCLPIFFINNLNEFPFIESVKYIKKYHADLFGDAFIQETFEV